MLAVVKTSYLHPKDAGSLNSKLGQATDTKLIDLRPEQCGYRRF